MQDDTILVVDDDARMRRLLRACLETEGFSVVEAADPAEARMCMRGSPTPSLVTLDLNLGSESGFDLARELVRTEHVPIIMVTGRGDVIDRVVGLEIGRTTMS